MVTEKVLTNKLFNILKKLMRKMLKCKECSLVLTDKNINTWFAYVNICRPKNKMKGLNFQRCDHCMDHALGNDGNHRNCRKMKNAKGK